MESVKVTQNRRDSTRISHEHKGLPGTSFTYLCCQDGSGVVHGVQPHEAIPPEESPYCIAIRNLDLSGQGPLNEPRLIALKGSDRGPHGVA